ncbi:hypothetical protein DPMN_033068 [Dreissena polymorpha]|uniref:Uncharacterized protein n=1 Tax=Dreissena polymorpha TaxID=45954 RepID=A0A9D4RIV2_DREPO|nr:hypothetical protein DPMN_033068 [Dreissena polymorpha]
MHTHIRLILCTTLVFHAFGQVVKKWYEFENVIGGAGSARTPWRSAASGKSSLRMFKGDQIQLSLCADVERTLSIYGLIYSNDGESDAIDVSVIDSTGVFFPYETEVTEETSGGWGMFRNSFISSVPFPATPLLLTPHTNTKTMLTVNEADCNGSEFDALDVTLSADVANETLWCDAKLIYVATRTPCAVRKFRNGKIIRIFENSIEWSVFEYQN